MQFLEDSIRRDGQVRPGVRGEGLGGPLQIGLRISPGDVRLQQCDFHPT